MLTGSDRTSKALARAVAVAIASGELEPKARRWGKLVLLEALAGVLGTAPTRLKNMYYRKDARLEALLLDYAMSNSGNVVDMLRNLAFRRFSPLVWKRPLEQLAMSRLSLTHTLCLLRLADSRLRADAAPPIELRREVGTVAAEVMACALTFFDGADRWALLEEADTIFRTAMGPLTLDHRIDEDDATLFARFWENRATRCGLEWSNIWDDPSTPPTIGMDIVDLAIEELNRATHWMKRHAAPAVDDGDRVRQFAADKAKWYAKAGRFDEAERQLKGIAPGSPAASADQMLIATLERIAANRLDEALRTGSALADQLGESTDSLAPVTSAIMVHNIELLRGRRPRLDDRIAEFLRESPVAASEHVNLPRYRARLAELGYTEAA